MGFYRAEKEIDFGDKKITVYELSVESLLKLAKGEYKTNEEIVIDNSSLEKEDLSKMSVEAWGKIQKEFYELNEKHFNVANAEKADEGK